MKRRYWIGFLVMIAMVVLAECQPAPSRLRAASRRANAHRASAHPMALPAAAGWPHR